MIKEVTLLNLVKEKRHLGGCVSPDSHLQSVLTEDTVPQKEKPEHPRPSSSSKRMDKTGLGSHSDLVWTLTWQKPGVHGCNEHQSQSGSGGADLQSYGDG